MNRPTVRTEIDFPDGDILCPGHTLRHCWGNMASYISSVFMLLKIIFVLRTVGDGFLAVKNLCNVVRLFVMSKGAPNELDMPNRRRKI